MHKFLFYNKFITFLYMFRALCAHHLEVKMILYSIWYQHTCRWPSGAQVERESSTCFEHYVLIIRRSKLYYTASGIITPVGGCPVHSLRESPLHASSTVVLIIRRSKLYYTASGIVTPVGGRPVHRLRESPLHASSIICSSSGGQNGIIQHLVSSHL